MQASAFGTIGAAFLYFDALNRQAIVTKCYCYCSLTSCNQLNCSSFCIVNKKYICFVV
ncbi:hypothetical protein DOY81_012585, partial [Sarcophaga bullata]